MYIETAYARRDSLSANELERLLTALKDEVDRYRYAIRNYAPERMEQHGRPFLLKLEERVLNVERLVSERSDGQNT